MPVDTDNLIEIGEIQKKYRFKKKLGAGGFGDVFHATEVESGRQVAIKMLELHSSNSGADAGSKAARFRREMELYNELEHPNIVKIFKSGKTVTGLMFIVFEFVSGQTLKQLIKKQGALSVERTRKLMAQVLDGISAAHRKGIIHRDLKPENIMVVQSEAGEYIKILDFGISTFISDRLKAYPKVTLTREFLGTPSYSTPEQLRGDPVSFKTDLYSWGLLYLECLTGKPPFRGSTVAHVIQQQLSSAPVPIPAPIADHPLGVLLRWTLEKQVSRRAGNGFHVLERLSRLSLEDVGDSAGYVSQKPVNRRGGSTTEGIAVWDAFIPSQERRQMTVLSFAINIEGYAEDSEILDELYNDLIGLCVKKTNEVGGHLETESGDRLLVYFGFPHASDTDPRRAARAALELSALITRRNAILSMERGIEFTYQIGLHTGMITVRAKPGGGKKCVGFTPNLAGKLCGLAPKNSILISEAANELLKSTLECDVYDISGAPVSPAFKKIFQVTGERQAEGITAIARESGTVLVGRDRELNILLRARETAAGKEKGACFLLMGEAGIGKSRLAAEFALALQQKQRAWLECRCTPENRNSALHPVLGLLKKTLGISHANKNGDALGLLEGKLKSYGMDLEQTVPLLSPWLGISMGTSYKLLQCSPQRQKEMLINDIATILVKIAENLSATVMIEDLHWVDSTTQEFLHVFIEKVRRQGLFLLMSARPEFNSPWKKNEVQQLELNNLGREEIERLIRKKTKGYGIPPDIVTQMAVRADGVPLFAEELSRMAMEKKGSKGKLGQATAEISREIPKTLRNLFESRLDRQGSAKETAQLASALGRAFDYDIISRVSLRDEAALLADLDQLVSAGLLHLRLRVGNPEYMFHHVLLRDTAYDSMTARARVYVHKHIANTLEREFEDIVENYPEEVARHLAGAEEYEKATQYGHRAAQSAFSRSLYNESINLALQSMAWNEKSAENEGRFEMEMNIVLTLCKAYQVTKGTLSGEALAMLEKAKGLSIHFPKASEMVINFLHHQILVYHLTPDFKTLETYLEKGFGIAEEFNNIEFLSFLHFVKGQDSFFKANLGESQRHLEKACELYEATKPEDRKLQTSGDIKVFSLSTLALLHASKGSVSKAESIIKEALLLADAIKSLHSKCMSMIYQLEMWHYLNNKARVAMLVDECIKFSTQNNVGIPIIPAQLFSGWARNDVETVRENFMAGEKRIFGQIATYWHTLVAQSEYDNALYGDALKRINGAIDLALERGELFYLPELYRIKARIIAKKDVSAAMQFFNKAKHTAKQAGEKLFEVRSLIDCYELSRDKEKLQTEIQCLVELLKDESGLKEKEEAASIIGI